MMAAADRQDLIWHIGNPVVHRALIQHCQRQIGPRPFLDEFQKAQDQGFTAIDLASFSPEERRDFRDCVTGLTALEPDEVIAALRVRYNPDRVHGDLCDLVDFLDWTLTDAP